MKLEISLFRFDCKSDYLPYYTKNYLVVKNEKTLLDLFNTINVDHPFSYENKNDSCVVVNGIYTPLSITINELTDNFGKDLTIEPISIRRSNNDFLINDDDFSSKLDILSDFISDEDIKTYQSYKIYFYASNTLNFEYNYIGDALLLLASDLIEKDKSNEEAILKALLDYDISAQYHTSLENRVYNIDSSIEEKICVIKEKLNFNKNIKEQNFNIDKKTKIDFGTFNNAQSIKHNFEDFNLAYYCGLSQDLETKDILRKLKANIINTPTMNSDLALQSFHLNSDFTMKLASTVMLDAFDNNADLIVVDNDEIFNLFDSNRKSLCDASGREIILPVIHKNELSKLVTGLHDEVKQTLSKHSVDPELI